MNLNFVISPKLDFQVTKTNSHRYKTNKFTLASSTARSPARVQVCMSAQNVADDQVVKAQPLNLPFCDYPKTANVSQHGLQNLPPFLPLADFQGAQPYRSHGQSVVAANFLTKYQMLQIAEVLSKSFSKREPQFRYFQPPKHPPEGLMATAHADVFGTDVFGQWNMERLLYWFIRLFVLTDPASPLADISLNDEVLKHSLVTVNAEGEVTAAVINKTMNSLEEEPAYRQDDVFLLAIHWFGMPFYEAVVRQQKESIHALSEAYPSFKDAFATGKIAHLWMLARSEKLAKANMFELVAKGAEHVRDMGYTYMIIEGSNQWTGAACEALGGTRVHFAPFQGWQAVKKSSIPVEGTVSSPNGWLSDKDSGCMLYVVRFS